MKEKFAQVEKEFLQDLAQAKEFNQLENLRIKYFGRKGIFNQLLKEIVKLKKEEKKEFGQLFNKLKEKLSQKLEKRFAKIKHREIKEKIDFSRPGKKFSIGHLHPLELTIDRAKKIFLGLGFSTVEGPEIVSEFENFDSLNIPADHPARDLWDTLWIKNLPHFLLRTHTSAYQVPYLSSHNLPIKIIIPGKVFRHEATDRTHDFQFHQLEGLYVNQKVSIGELKGVLIEFFKEFFNKDLPLRFRPSYFSFVEPGLEVDIGCPNCDQKGCSVCKNSGYIEILGAGMVHPKVFESAHLDPNNWQGFAFGMGIERLAMLQYKINDIRLFHSGDLRFIRQF